MCGVCMVGKKDVGPYCNLIQVLHRCQQTSIGLSSSCVMLASFSNVGLSCYGQIEQSKIELGKR